MSSTSWSIKRKRPSPATSSKKRHRPNDEATTSSAKRQQTLTQAQWVSSRPPSFQDDFGCRSEDKRAKAKRNTTLTQMDFFNGHVLQEIDDTPLLEEGIQEQATNIPQVDGSYESPRKPRKRKFQAVTGGSEPATGKRLAYIPSIDSQDYQPFKSKRRKPGDAEIPDDNKPRRTSNRIRKVLSDPAENLDYFQSALPSTENHTPRRAEKIQQPPLEIKDSYESDNDVENVPPQSQALRPPAMPRTPPKQKVVILSSQSPESLPPTTKRMNRIYSDSPRRPKRSPLRERSTNLLLEANGVNSRGSPSRRSLKRKIVTLKLSRRRIAQQKPRVADSQADIYSIQATSSPKSVSIWSGPRPDDALISSLPAFTIAPKADTDAVVAGPEIPSTSQVQGFTSNSPYVETQESLQSIGAILGITSPSLACRASETTDIRQTHEDNEMVTVRDFAFDENTPRAPVIRQNSMLVAPVPTLEQGEDDDSTSDFGSPIANDTQFNADVDIRTSSPQPIALAMPSITSPAPRSNDDQEPETEDAETEEAIYEVTSDSSIPTPRLVHQSDQQNLKPNTAKPNSNPDELSLPRNPIETQYSTHLLTTRVPLNDLPPSSSPTIHSSTNPVTQKSAHPASMPHPSQISTQEATQGFGMSSIGAGEPDEDDDDAVERISIKDSSSVRMSMSQIPIHERSQSQLNIDLGLGEWEDDDVDDYDLDPSSAAHLPAEQQHVKAEDLITPKAKISGAVTATAVEAPQEKHEPDMSQHPVDGYMEIDEPSSQSDPMLSSPKPPPLRNKYPPLPGFDNETQSNFTQGGHVSAAFVHRQWEEGHLPTWYIPKPYQVPGYRR